MNWCDDVPFPARCKPLPPGYKVIHLDSGHFMWAAEEASNDNGGPLEGLICWDRWWVRRCAFANYEARRFVAFLVALRLKERAA